MGEAHMYRRAMYIGIGICIYLYTREIDWACILDINRARKLFFLCICIVVDVLHFASFCTY
jgi:hypothetical protein